MIIQNKEILLTVKEVGRTVRSEVKKKESVKFHYFERDNYNWPNPSKPKRNVMTEGRGTVEYYPFIPSECSRKIKLSSDFVNNAISEKEVPYRINVSTWKHLSDQERLEYNLNLVAEGKPFTYELM